MAKKTADWLKEIKAYHTATADWRRSARRIVDRYRLEKEMSATAGREGARKNSTFNILWSNVQTMKPALFARVPTIEAERRHGDQDPLGRIASMVLERAANEELERNDFFDSMTAVVLDVLLVGRGVPWVRFEADELPDVPVKRRLFGVDSGMEVPADALTEEDEHGLLFDMGNGPAMAEARFMTNDGGVAPPDDVSEVKGNLMWQDRGTINERVFVDYVHWNDFAHSPERNWSDLKRRGWVARRVAMTRSEGVERFGKGFADVEMTLSRRTTDRDDSQAVPETGRKYGEVWEIWDKESMSRVFVAKGIEKPLEAADDPYGLTEFFPCPRPAYATTSNEDMVPTPDYLQYADLADELDDISGRIRRLTRALKLVGVYDASAEGLGKALTGNIDGKMIPVTNFAALVGKSAGVGGGLNGVAQWIPMDHVVEAMLGLYDARDRVKQTLYEVSGVSDIVRGQVDPREKATQSRLKAQFATARLDTRRRAVERVARDAARIQIELMAELYGPDTLREQSGFDLLPEAAEYDDAVKEQIWGQVVELLEDDKIRGFRIDVETDSTVEMDAGQTQESRTEFLQSAGNFLNNALPIAQQMPEMVKPISEMLLFTVRSYKAGRSLESAFEEAATKLQKKVEQAEQQPQQQDPEAAAKAQEAQQRMQVEGAKGQAQIQLLQQKGQVESQKGQLQIQTIQQKAQLDAQGGELQLQTKAQAGQLDVAMSEQQLEQAAAQHELELEKIRVQIATMKQRKAAQS